MTNCTCDDNFGSAARQNCALHGIGASLEAQNDRLRDFDARKAARRNYDPYNVVPVKP